MQQSFKLVTGLLLVMMIALPVAAQISLLKPTARATGCDEHGGTMPPHPVSYACCQAGHNTAAVQEAFSWRNSPGRVLATLDASTSAVSLTEAGIALVPMASDSPPLSISLRI